MMSILAVAEQLPGIKTGQEHVDWVLKSLAQMESIKPGMTREDLLKVFREEGGLSTPLRRIYVYRGCPFFKVDVEFEVVGRPERDRDGRVTLIESGADKIKSISMPFIALSVAD